MSATGLLDALRAEGLRITSARTALCEVLAASPEDHLSVTDLRRRAEDRMGAAMDASTVYRTIEVLQGLGLVGHVHTGQGATVVHLVDEPHHHLSCRLCGLVVDIPAVEALAGLRPIADRHGFVADSLHFALVGTCRECAEEERHAEV